MPIGALSTYNKRIIPQDLREIKSVLKMFTIFAYEKVIPLSIALAGVFFHNKKTKTVKYLCIFARVTLQKAFLVLQSIMSKRGICALKPSVFIRRTR